MSTTRPALARLYRPRRFAEVAMQPHVSETLKGAVARGRVAHAYLFSGPRGVGKTTAARVLAMALNCTARTAAGEPCGECESCERIWAGQTSLDVVEIDAASNRGVDDARDLRERAMYAPTDERRFKVYIIDEAHMLTREAWNALLKILEEPPPRVIFVFATTEPQRIQQAASPVLSRCQRFEFRRISVSGILDRLRQVAAAEQIEASDDVLLPIARRAQGGMRDALSMLDQLLSFTEGRPSTEDVRRILGLVDEELYLDLFDILAARRYADVFRFVQRLLDEGYDLVEFYRGLADALRGLLISRFDGPEVSDVREDLRDAFAKHAAHFQAGDLLRMLAQVAELDADGRFRKSTDPRLLLEALLLRLAHLDRTVEIETLIAAASGSSIDPPPVRPAPGPVLPPGSARAPAEPAPAAPASESSSSQASREASQPPARVARDSRPADSAPTEPSASASAASAPVSPPPGPRPRGETGTAEAAFRSVLEEGTGLPGGLSFLLRAGRIAETSPGRIRLELPPGAPALDHLTDGSATRRALEAALGARLDQAVTLEVAASGSERSAPPPRLTPDRLRSERLAKLAAEEPVLSRAVKEWDLELLE